MAQTKDELFLLKEVFNKVKYDELTERYTISLEDYTFLNLTPNQIKILKRMCEENNIYLEQLPETLNHQETKLLFEKYNEIKTKLKKNTNYKTYLNLKQQLIEIKNKIVIGYMGIVYNLINRCIPEIKDMQDKEDIYQIGYETLIEFIDKYDETKASTFTYFISKYMMHYVIKKIYQSYANIKGNQKDRLKRINEVRNKADKVLTISKLSEATGYPKESVKSMLLLEKIINPSDIDLAEEALTPDLIDDNFEVRMIDGILEENDYINKLMDTLPEIEKRVIRLYYGFVDGKTYTQEEIAKIIGTSSRERIRQIKEIGLRILANTIGSNYLIDIHGNTPYQEAYKNRTRIHLLPKSKLIIEDILIDSIERESLLYLINNLHPKNRKILLLYYGLEDGIKYDYDEISKILGIKKAEIVDRKHGSVDLIIKLYVKNLNPNFKGDYIEYLMNNYLNTPRRKR